ncbi:FlgB family protein [Poseidonocella sp. HB161398]|uniref:FlgB family protein n=1 Tax=Poseidonocella sp. HB161398 TaxID=2320855 RepID=UPI001108260F|nr:FlgB family protein [Poseidonocella sp. HB161398]
MFSSLEIFKTASALAAHSGARQAVISQNMANADTPGYRAMDVRGFADTYRSTLGPLQLRTTRAAHFTSPEIPGARFGVQAVERPGDASPNGNTVSLEQEMLNAVETRYSHDVALTAYRSGLNLLRTSLGRS